MPGLAAAARVAGLVTSMAVLTIGGALLGRELDARWATEPWLLVAGLFGGFVVGMVALSRELIRLGTDDDEADPS